MDLDRAFAPARAAEDQLGARLFSGEPEDAGAASVADDAPDDPRRDVPRRRRAPTVEAGGAETGIVWAGSSGAAGSGAGASSGGVIGPVIPTGSPAEIPITGVETAFLVTGTGLLAITATPIGAGTACATATWCPVPTGTESPIAAPRSGARVRSGRR